MSPCNACVTLSLSSVLQLGNGTAHAWFPPCERWGRGKLPSYQPGEVLQLQQHGRWTAAMTVCSGLLILLVLGKRREMLAHTFGPTRMLLPVSSSCTPRNCTDVPGAPLPLCPHEGLRSKDMRRISAQDLSTPDSPSFQLYSSLISFHWRSWDFNMQLICLTDRHSFLPHWNSSVKINHLIVHPPWGGCDTVKTRKINCFQTQRTNHSLKLPNITHQKQATSPELCETT